MITAAGLDRGDGADRPVPWGYGLRRICVAALPLIVSLFLLAVGAESTLAVRVACLTLLGSAVALAADWFLAGDYSRHIGWVYLVGGCGIWFAFPAGYLAASQSVWFGEWIHMPVPSDALLFAAVLISIFFLGNAVAYWTLTGLLGKDRPARRTAGEEVSLFSPRGRRIVLLVCFAFGFAPYVVFGGTLLDIFLGVLQGRGEKAWAVATASSYEGNPLMTMFWLSRAFLVAGGNLVGLYALSRRPQGAWARVGYGFLFALTSLVVYFDQGTRSVFIMTVLPPFVAAALMWTRRPDGEPSRIRMGVVGGSAVIALLLLTQLQMLYRLERTRSQIGQTSVLELIAPKQQTDFFTETANAVVLRRDLPRGTLDESPLLFFAVNPIPRVLWPDKPLPQTIYYYTYYRWGVNIWDKGGNAIPSVVGQYFLNGGVVGVMWIGLLYGALVALLGLLARRPPTETVLAAMSGLTFFLVSYRYLGPGFHYSSMLLLLIVMIYPRLVAAPVRRAPLRPLA